MSYLKSQNTFANNLGLFILRVSFGAAMLFGHGLGKWTKLFGGEEIHFLDPFGLGATTSLALAVFAEVICSVLIMLGLLTRLATIPLIITMLIAFNVHLSDSFGMQEKSILYLVIYIVLLLQGPGKLSVDGLLIKKR
ncbi:DoxX family protein [Wenyingzhuangia fucanilytica]|uniref:DoxX family protein n=1 Tax=Wenyingzhuangia fucanilytica TaxID=1790137 RepID=A0A1B1Y5N1_9FLAO|nr:DoxX family protein [Wenyingzhuangia fucanilytica]ANW96054.1 DoxX family protein [Wenyingzhuangia fucanilytica]